MSRINKIGRGIVKHIVDTTALNTLANPIFGALEVFKYDMSDNVSFNSRVFGSVLGYCGTAYIISMGRTISRKLFNIRETSNEIVQFIHDGVGIATFNAFFCPIMYNCSGETDKEKIVTGTLTAMAVSLVSGGFFGYGLDAFRDLSGVYKNKRIEESFEKLSKSIETFGDFMGAYRNDRTPKSMKELTKIAEQRPNYFSGLFFISDRVKECAEKYTNMGRKTKMGIAGLIISASIGINAGIYALTPDKFDWNKTKQTKNIEEIINK